MPCMEKLNNANVDKIVSFMKLELSAIIWAKYNAIRKIECLALVHNQEILSFASSKFNYGQSESRTRFL